MGTRIRQRGAWTATLALSAALILAFAFAFPARAHADGTLAAGAEKDKYHQLSGTVYFSYSHDAKFGVSGGNVPGVVMANVPIDLAEVCEFDLDECGLGDYKLAAPTDAPYEYECTFLQLFAYAEALYAANPNMQVTGDPHSSYIKQYWGDDENFLYYVNGRYPMDGSLGAGMGATSDVLPLKDGDTLTVAHYSDWSFWSDGDAGFHFFLDADGTATHTYVAQTGEPFAARLVRAFEDSSAPSGTAYTPESGWTVWWGEVYDDFPNNASAAGHATTDAKGAVELTFDEPGTYYAWVDGGKSSSTGKVVSSPACVRVVVSDSPAPQAHVPKASEGLVYNGGEQVGVTAGEGCVLSGVCAATDAGDYVAYAAPADGWTWSDGTTTLREIPWSIARASIAGAEVGVVSSGGALDVMAALGGHALGPGDFEASVSASFASDAGTAAVTVVVRGAGNYSGTAIAQIEVDSDAVRMRVDPTRAAFTGARVIPRVVVSAGGSQLAASDYELRYANQATGASSRVAPTSVGSYRIVALLGADASERLGYDSVSVSVPFEVYDPVAEPPGSGGDDSGQGPESGDKAGGPSGEAGAKAANPMKVKAKSVKAKAKKLKKRARKVRAVTVSGAEGAVSYKIVKVKAKKKLLKQARRKIKLAAGGMLKLGKKLKKGTYKVTVEVKAAGNASFEPVTKTVTVKVEVK